MVGITKDFNRFENQSPSSTSIDPGVGKGVDMKRTIIRNSVPIENTTWFFSDLPPGARQGSSPVFPGHG